jgi:hypothetical protein
MPGIGLSTTIKPVLVSHDKGEQVYDVVISARDIHRMWTHGLIRIDDERQRGVNSTTGKQVVKQQKVDKWTEQLLKDEHVFGQLTWNFRPEETKAFYDEELDAFVIQDGSATLPDSGHRHRAIVAAVESVSRGSSFNPDMLFSVRIWRVSANAESEIFYGMNQEGDKADATRSKYLMQRNPGERIARELVRRSEHLTEQNVEVVSNTLSARNPRLGAFNTISKAIEGAFADASLEEVDDVVEYLLGFWDRLVDVRPELRLLSLSERQRVRKQSLAGSALAIHGYMGLARRIRDRGLGLEALEALRAEPGEEDFLAMANPEWQERGIVVPSENRAGETTLAVRNALQTRRAMADALAERVGAVRDDPALAAA